MRQFEERSTKTYRQKQLFGKDELEARETVCIRNEPAFCAAACPLKLDARAFVNAVRNGDFSGARALLGRIAPFPLILAYGCEAPCENACRLSETGEGVAIGALERACLAFGTGKTESRLLRLRKKKTVAVFGADLFSLALVGELSNKAYPVTFFCQEQDAQAVIKACAPFLDAEKQAAEAERLSNLDITTIYHTDIHKDFFAAQRENFNILCASREAARAFAPGENADPVTLVYPVLGLVAPAEASNGVLLSLYDAKRAAVSVDRLAQGLRPASARGEEGALTSRLYTNMLQVQPSRRVPERGGYGEAEARQEAARCIDCRCEECAKGCAYLRHYGKYPRELIREIYNNVGIIMGDHTMNRPINSCALCGQCAHTCPFGIDMAGLCQMARENMVETGKMPLAPHEFALHDMLFSNGEAFLARAQPGYETCRYLFFPGCQAGAVAAETVDRAYRDLCARLPGGVAFMSGCCGVIARWAGRSELYGETARFLESEWIKLGAPEVIACCPTCHKTLRGIMDGKITGIWEILSEIGLPEEAKPVPRAAAMHDSCGARGDEQTQKAVRRLAEQLGCKLIETEYSGDKSACCGYGGLVSYANREVARKLARSCVAESEAPYITYCMACRDRFSREGHESVHILELIYGPPPGAPPDISEKRRNRLFLKKRLLREIWEEKMREKDFAFSVTITEKAREEMDDRMIMIEDIYAVMQDYHENGNAVIENETGLSIACRRIGNVTFWVRFQEEEGSYVVHGAYSHRMTVK